MQTRTPSASSPSPTPLTLRRRDSATNARDIANIPDLDGDAPHDDEERIAKALGGVSLGAGGGVEGVGTTETPDLDNILNMVAFMKGR